MGVDSSNAGTAELLADAATALSQRAWPQARTLYRAALDQQESAGALEGLAVASWWQDDVDAAIEARERAYVLRRERGEDVEAARVAGFLAWDYGAMRGANAVANGWLQRARRLLEELEPSAEQAWLPLIEASFHLDTDAGAVLRLSAGRPSTRARMARLDIEMTARTLQGLALVSLGRVEEGTRLLDEGTAAATAGELHDPIAIGSCCCNMIIACERARDFDRAGQWCEQLAAFCERTGQRPLLALCRAHHGTVLHDARRVGRGRAASWRGRPASCRRCARRWPATRAPGWRSCAGARGEPRRRGRCWPGPARTCWRRSCRPSSRSTRAIRRPRSATPSVYLRALGDQRADRERRSARAARRDPDRALGELERRARRARPARGDRRRRRHRLAARGRALARPVRIALADGELDLARRALRGCGRPARALRRALRGGAGAAGARPRAGRRGPRRAALEQAVAARATFAQLGAARATREADRLVERLGGRSAAAKRAGLTGRELEVLALVAAGLSNRQIAEQLVVSEHTVHRHLANIYVRLGVSSRAAAVAVAAERGLLD